MSKYSSSKGRTKANLEDERIQSLAKWEALQESSSFCFSFTENLIDGRSPKEIETVSGQSNWDPLYATGCILPFRRDLLLEQFYKTFQDWYFPQYLMFISSLNLGLCIFCLPLNGGLACKLCKDVESVGAEDLGDQDLGGSVQPVRIDVAKCQLGWKWIEYNLVTLKYQRPEAWTTHL